MHGRTAATIAEWVCFVEGQTLRSALLHYFGSSSSFLSTNSNLSQCLFTFTQDDFHSFENIIMDVPFTDDFFSTSFLEERSYIIMDMC